MNRTWRLSPATVEDPAMLAGLGGKARSGIRNFDHHDGAFAPPGDPQLGVAGRLGGLAVERLHGIAREIEQHPEQLIGISIDIEAAIDGADPADRCA